ncbi:MAG: TolC family outer membrane protein [Nitrospinae bacterium]|nr:TolC family outer membrane protein [Nitrospinota bacterium]
MKTKDKETAATRTQRRRASKLSGQYESVVRPDCCPKGKTRETNAVRGVLHPGLYVYKSAKLLTLGHRGEEHPDEHLGNSQRRPRGSNWTTLPRSHGWNDLLFSVPLCLCGLILSSLISGPAFADEPARAGFREIYDLARANDAVFASAQSALAAGREKGSQAYSMVLPSINLSADAKVVDSRTTYRNQPADSAYTTKKQNYDSESVNVSLSQPIFRMGNFAAYSQLKLQAEQAELQFASASQELVLRAAQAYFDVLLAQDTVEFVRAQKKAIGEQLQQARRMFELGAATITDTHDAQARNDIATSQEIAAINDLEIKKQALARLIGAPPPPLTPLSDSLEMTTPSPDSASEWMEMADKGSPLLRSARLGLQIAREETSKSRSGHYPTIDMIAGYNYSGVGDSQYNIGYDNTAKYAGAQVTFPLFAGGATASKVRESAALEEKTSRDVEDASRQAKLAAYSAFMNVTNGAARVNALGQALVSSEKSLDSTKKGLEVGVRTAVDALNAQQQLFSARRDYAQAKYSYVISLLMLKASAGELSETVVDEIAAMLDGGNGMRE